MASESANRIRITKLDAARRQIETALDLWFHDGDPVSIHTLTAAANRIVLDISEHQGGTAGPFDMKPYKPARHKELKILMRKAETFFKHAKNDPDPSAEITLNTDWTEFYLYHTVLGYRALEHRKNALMDLFDFRFVLLHPQYFRTDLFQDPSKADYIKRLRGLSRVELFNELLSDFQIAAR